MSESVPAAASSVQSVQSSHPSPVPKQARKIYSAEFKQNAVKLITELGRSYKDTALQLGCSQPVLRDWVSKHLATLSPPKRAEVIHISEQLRTAQKENTRLKMENDFLKKQRRTLPRSQSEVRLDHQEQRLLSHCNNVPNLGCFSKWLL